MADKTFKYARAFQPLLAPARYKGAYGGRGSGKSHFFADLVVASHLNAPGLRTVCIREVLKSLRESAKLLIEDKIHAWGVGDRFVIQSDRIVGPGGGLIVFVGMQDQSAESIKSFEGFGRAWVEEAQTLSERSLTLLRPTIRQEDSEIWFSWNPRRKQDAVDAFFRGNHRDRDDVWDPPPDSVVVKANWRDNPWFPKELEIERRHDRSAYPERYDHVWEGDYAKAFEGAYFSKLLQQAREERRIGNVKKDSLLPLRAFFDIGGAGASADAMAIWIIQWVAAEIRVLDYIEGSGQVLDYYVHVLRQRGYSDAICYLPHDGLNRNNITGKRYLDHIADAGFECIGVPNQGRGAAMQRVEAVRRVLPHCWFNEKTTEGGREALGFYHEKKDDKRSIGLGPSHDWSSHAADAFGLMAVTYQGPVGPGLDEDELFPRRDRGIDDMTRNSITGY